MLQEFEICFKRINTFLQLIGLSIDSDDNNRTTWERLRKHWMCLIHFLSFNLSVFGEIIWFVRSMIVGTTLWEITYLIPCLTLCFLGNCKLFCFIHEMRHVNDLVKVLRMMQSNVVTYGVEKEGEIRKWVAFLSTVCKILLVLTMLGVGAFALGPLVITASYYLTTGEIKFVLPFLIWYPFDALNIRFWPFVYLQQMWSAWVAVFSVYGPDCFYFTCCTFIQIQFLILQDELERIVKRQSWNRQNSTISAFKAEFVQLINKHRELIRCVSLLEIIYSKATLFNVVTSSLIICATGFNLMVIENLALMAPFTSFLSFGLLQIFFYCYYGDYVMRSSMGIGDAVYNSHWYKTGVVERKYLLIVLVRTQKPCKLTAYGFTDVNFRAFTRILSTSWSYFALLKQMYHN